MAKKRSGLTVGESTSRDRKSGLSGGDNFSAFFISDRSIGPVARDQQGFIERLEQAASVRSTDTVAWMNQVHGTSLCHVGRDHKHQVSVKEIDGMWTDQKGVMLIAKTADCAPLLMRSEEAGVVAAIHCGWNGFFEGILENFAALWEERGFRPGSFSAFIGPMLRERNFEVRQDFIDKVPDAKRSFLVRRGERTTFDLARGIASTLGGLGVTQIEDCGVDTYTSEEYYSYRRWTHADPATRRETYMTFASAIVMR